MADKRQQLVEYLKTYLAQGYTKEQLYSSLLNQGYKKNQLDSAFRRIDSETITVLKNSVRQWKTQGYSNAEARQWLLDKGYSENIVNRVVKPEGKRTSFLAIIVGIVLVIGIAFAGFSLLKPVSEPLHSVNNISSPDKGLQPQTNIDNETTIKTDPLPGIVENNTKEDDVSVAIKQCNSLDENKSIDNCKLSLAEDKDNPKLCSYIDDVAIRDQCYLNFIYDGYSEQCENVELNDSKDFCKILEEY